MAVPDTTTFTLQNVVDFIQPTVASLGGCYFDALSYGFDEIYSYYEPNSLMRFRNYDEPDISSFYISPTSLTFDEMGGTKTLSISFQSRFYQVNVEAINMGYGTNWVSFSTSTLYSNTNLSVTCSIMLYGEADKNMTIRFTLRLKSSPTVIAKTTNINIFQHAELIPE